MAGHLSIEVMNGYARRALPPLDLLAADDHLEACGVCRERISDDAGLKEAIRSLLQALQPDEAQEAGHLSYEQLETHAEGGLSRAEKEIVDAHLGWCELCAAEARDFAAFARLARIAIASGAASQAASVGRKPTEDRRPPEIARIARVAVPQAVREETRSAAPEPTGEREPEPEPEPARRSTRSALLIALCLGLVAAVAAAWLVPAMLRRQVGELNAQVEALRKTNEALALQAGETESLRAELEKVRAEAAEVPGPAEPAAATAPAAEASTAAEAPTSAVTLIDRRGQVGLDANGDLIGLDGLPVGAGRAIAAAIRSHQAGAPSGLPDLSQPATAPAQEDAAGAIARPLSPVATIVWDTRPTFSWQAQPGAVGYTVALFDDGLNPIARGEALRRTTWRPSRPLKRGAVYAWQVIVRGRQDEGPSATPPAPTARFQVLGAAESTSLERLVRDSGGSHLAAGVLLARAGCIVDARGQFQELIRKNPDSPVARDLLQSLPAAGPEPEPGGQSPSR
jgi:hypothetical protein